MSLRSMSAMRADVEAAGEEGGAAVPDPGVAKKALTDQLIALVPAEAIALYVVLIGLLAKEEEVWRWVSFGVVFIFTVGWILISYWEKGGARDRVPWLEVIVGVVAYVTWTTTVPQGTLTDLGGSTVAGAVAVAIVSALLTGVVRAQAVWVKQT